MTDLTKTIEELKALEIEATPGPWTMRAGKKYEGIVYVPFKPDPDDDRLMYIDSIRANHAEDAALIVAMRNALPELLEFAYDADQENARWDDVSCDTCVLQGRESCDEICSSKATLIDMLSAEVKKMEARAEQAEAEIEELKTKDNLNAVDLAAKFTTDLFRGVCELAGADKETLDKLPAAFPVEFHCPHCGHKSTSKDEMIDHDANCAAHPAQVELAQWKARAQKAEAERDWLALQLQRIHNGCATRAAEAEWWLKRAECEAAKAGESEEE